MSLVEIQDDGLIVINDPLVSVSGLLEEARLHTEQQQQQQQNQRNASRSNNSTSGMYLQRIWIENDEIAEEIQERPWRSLEIVSCQGSKLPALVAAALRQPSLEKFALRKIASRLQNCIHAMRVSGLRHLKDLTLEVALSERSCQSLASALDTTSPWCCSLTNLKLERCSFIIPSALSAFAEGLKYNSSLTTLSMIKCRLQDDDLQVLSQCLPSSLRNLDLTGNFCRNQLGALVSSKVESLNLTNQHPGEMGGSLDLSEIGPALASNTTLRSLDLSFNMLTLENIRELVDALDTTTGGCSNSEEGVLKTLNLMSNQLDDSAIQYIGGKLPGMRGLDRLDISSNRFGDVGAAALLQGLRRNYTLCHLEMPRGFEELDEIRYLLALNRGGRRLLQRPQVEVGRQDTLSTPSRVQSPIPLGLWPVVFERVNRLSIDNNGSLSNSDYMRASVILFLLKEGPIWIGHEH